MSFFGWLGSLARSRHKQEKSVVAFDERRVTCLRPNGATESVEWAELRSVEIRTTDSGPWAEDVFVVLYGRGCGCVIPQGAEGFDALLKRLQQLPNFDNRAVIEAMGCTENACFPCWSAVDD
jgi:hypothetical protein